MTRDEAQQLLNEKYMVQLKGAPFDQEDPGLCDASQFVAGFNGKCSVCPHRTGNNKELFGEVKRGDVCTNPACYRAKSTAAFALVAAEAKKNREHKLTQDKEASRKAITETVRELKRKGKY